jgi:hypothetical protein
VTRLVYEKLKDEFVLEARAPIEVTGKGSVEAWSLKRQRPGRSRKLCRLGNCRCLGTEVVPTAPMSLVSAILGRACRAAGCQEHGCQHRGGERLEAKMCHAVGMRLLHPGFNRPDFTSSATPASCSIRHDLTAENAVCS